MKSNPLMMTFRSDMQIIVPLKMTAQWSSNTIYAGVHWTVRKKQADEIHEMVGWLVKGKKPFDKPVEITCEFGGRLDIDNCSYVAKLIVDGLRKNGILKDDTRKYVQGLHLLPWDGEGIRVTVKEA